MDYLAGNVQLVIAIFEKIFLSGLSKDFSNKLSESIKFDDLRIDETVKKNLINIVNLFSTWAVYDVE